MFNQEFAKICRQTEEELAAMVLYSSCDGLSPILHHDSISQTGISACIRITDLYAYHQSESFFDSPEFDRCVSLRTEAKIRFESYLELVGLVDANVTPARKFGMIFQKITSPEGKIRTVLNLEKEDVVDWFRAGLIECTEEYVHDIFQMLETTDKSVKILSGRAWHLGVFGAETLGAIDAALAEMRNCGKLYLSETLVWNIDDYRSAVIGKPSERVIALSKMRRLLWLEKRWTYDDRKHVRHDDVAKTFNELKALDARGLNVSRLGQWLIKEYDELKCVADGCACEWQM